MDFLKSGFDAVSRGALAEIIEHHDGAEKNRCGIGHAFSGDVGSCTMGDAADDAQAADQACSLFIIAG